MALYFKCPKCGKYFIDYYGENAADDTEECFLKGPYLCPECDTESVSIDQKEYNKIFQKIDEFFDTVSEEKLFEIDSKLESIKEDVTIEDFLLR